MEPFTILTPEKVAPVDTILCVAAQPQDAIAKPSAFVPVGT